ncbi:MAG: putative membrane protein, partial [uncultured Pseudonocardia sp.]
GHVADPPDGRGPGPAHRRHRARRRPDGPGGEGARPAPDEAAGHRPAPRRRGGVPAGPLVGVGGRAGVDRLRPRDGRGGDGRRAGRLVRRHGAVPAPARAADPAHRDHPHEEGRHRRQPGRLRGGELPVRAGGARQAGPRAGGLPRRRVDRAGGQRRPRHRRAGHRRPRGGHGAARRGRAGGHRAGARPQADGAPGRAAAGDGAGGRAGRRVPPPPGRPGHRPGLRLGVEQPGHGPERGARPRAVVVAAVRRRPHRRPRVPGGADLRLRGEDRPGAPAAQGGRPLPRRVRPRPAERPRHHRAGREGQAADRGPPRRAEVHRRRVGRGEGADPRRGGRPVERAAPARPRRPARAGPAAVGRRGDAGQGRRLAGRRGGLRRAPLPGRDHHAHHRHRRALGRRGDQPQGGAPGGPGPAVHPHQRHRGRGAGRSGDLHGEPAAVQL